MRLPSDGREYATWTVTDLPVDVVTMDVKFFDADTWHSMSVTAGEVKILIAGPDADPAGAVVLPVGKIFPRMRATDNPEIVIRESDPIYVYEVTA